MNEKKLRPEQRKLWRRIFLTAFDTGATVAEATAMADKSVVEWEARGAFEADVPPTSSDSNASGKPFTTWEAFSNVVVRMLDDGRETEQIAELGVAYPDEFDFMRELVAMVDKHPAKFDMEHLSQLRSVFETGNVVAHLNGIEAGRVTNFELMHLTDRPVAKLRVTVESTFSLNKSAP